MSVLSESRRGAFLSVFRLDLVLELLPLSPSTYDDDPVCEAVLPFEPVRDGRGRVRVGPPG
jgi:hypothetical protein